MYIRRPNLNIMENINHVVLRLMLLSLSIFLYLTSCINPEYDMDKVLDNETTILENLYIPLGSVDKLTLEQILFTDAEMPQAINKNEDGDLYLNVFSDKFSSSYHVPTSFYLNNFEFEGLNLNMYTDEFAGMNTSSLPAQNITYSSLNGGKPIDVNGRLDIYTSFPSEIYDVKDIQLASKMKCYFQDSGAPVTIKKGFEIIYPDFVHLEKSDNIAAYTVVDGHILHFNSDVRLDINETLELLVLLDSIRIPAGSVKTDARGGRFISIEDSIRMTGDLSFYTKDVSVIPEVISLMFWMNYNMSQVKSAEVSLDVNLDIADQDIRISEIPEIFAGKNSCVDLYNPQMAVDIVNSTILPCSMTADIVANNDSGAELKLSLNKSDGLSVAAGATANYVISRREIPASGGAVNIVKPVIGDMIKDIPEKISIKNCSIEVPKDFVVIEVGKLYQASVGYDVTAPLAFGEDLSFSFSQDIKNLGLEIEAEIRAVVFELNLINSIPLDFGLTAKCIDENGNEVTDTNVLMDAEIKAGSQNSPVTNCVKFEIRPAGGKLNIDGLRLTMHANAPEGSLLGFPLNEKQGFEIKDIVLILPDGIGIDL